MKNDFGVDRGNATESEKMVRVIKSPPPHELLLSGENKLETLSNT